MVAVGWEPDGHAGGDDEGIGKCPVDSHEFFGTHHEYVEQYKHAQKRFEEYGVTNAIWIIDYSHKAAWDPAFRAVVPALIPPKIDWIFWNMFQYHSEKSYQRFTTNVRNEGKATSPVKSTDTLEGFYNLLDSVPQAEGKPWGLGAWGTTYKQQDPAYNKWGTKGSLIPKEDREAFINDAKTWLSEHTDKVKASVYFDSLDSIIGDGNADGVVQLSPCKKKTDIECPLPSSEGPETTFAVQNAGDLAHNFELEYFLTSPEMVPTFKEYNEAEMFTKCDALVGN